MNKPYWQETDSKAKFPALDRDIVVDCLIVGGGITGVTAAYLLLKEGLSVALVERDWIGAGDTSHTTGHLTYMTDTRLSELVATHGEDDARLAWEAGRGAIDFIRDIVREYEIECELTEVPGYLVAAYDADWDKERRELQDEARMAQKLGFAVNYIENAPPENKRPGIHFPGQYKFHPLKYLHAMIQKCDELGVQIFEETDVSGFETKPRSARANGHKIDFNSVVIATHVPLQGNTSTIPAALFQSKLASYSTYAISAKIPSGSLPEMIWSDTDHPFLYLRVGRGVGYDFAILGGEDHKTGQKDHPGVCYSHLEDALDNLVSDATNDHRWTGQVVETVDGLPYIGPNDEGQFLATGFSGNGLTFGTVAAMMARDSICQRPNPYAALFCLTRKKLGAIPDYLKENSDFPVRMISDRVGVPKEDPEQLPRGCGKILHHDGHCVAAYRDFKGELHEVSAVCPHLGCIVAWNDAEKTWDCPCHGSRFASTGELIAGPAEKGLEPVKAETH